MTGLIRLGDKIILISVVLFLKPILQLAETDANLLNEIDDPIRKRIRKQNKASKIDGKKLFHETKTITQNE